MQTTARNWFGWAYFLHCSWMENAARTLTPISISLMTKLTPAVWKPTPRRPSRNGGQGWRSAFLPGSDRKQWIWRQARSKEWWWVYGSERWWSFRLACCELLHHSELEFFIPTVQNAINTVKFSLDGDTRKAVLTKKGSRHQSVCYRQPCDALGTHSSVPRID